MSDKPSNKSNSHNGFLDCSEELLKDAVHTALINPLNNVLQVCGKSQVDWLKPDEKASGIKGFCKQAGEMAGQIFRFMALRKGVGKLFGEEPNLVNLGTKSITAKSLSLSGLTGFGDGYLFTPVDHNNSGLFSKDRFINGSVNAGSMLITDLSPNLFNKIPGLHNIPQNFVGDLGRNIFAGSLGGMSQVSLADGLKEHRLASGSELGSAAFGGAFGGALFHTLPYIGKRFVPDLSLINANSHELSSKEPFESQLPFLAEFQQNGRSLYYVASHHDNDISSDTFRLINDCFEKRPIEAVVLEGFPWKAGVNPKAQMEGCSKKTNGLYDYKDTGYAIEKAKERGIPFVGAEPTDLALYQHLRKAKPGVEYTTKDIIGHYFAKYVPSLRDRSDGKTPKELFEKEVPLYCKKVGLTGSDSDLTWNEFLEWYHHHSRTEFSFENLSLNDVQPLNKDNGGNFIQQMSAAEEVVRDRHILTTIAKALNSKQHVLVVYGRGHLARQRRALEKMLGDPIRQVNASGNEWHEP